MSSTIEQTADLSRSEQQRAVEPYADTVIPAEVASEILTSVIARVLARTYEIEDSDPAEDARLTAIRQKLIAERRSIDVDTPAHNHAIAAKWGALLKDDTALWNELNG